MKSAPSSLIKSRILSGLRTWKTSWKKLWANPACKRQPEARYPPPLRKYLPWSSTTFWHPSATNCPFTLRKCSRWSTSTSSKTTLVSKRSWWLNTESKASSSKSSPTSIPTLSKTNKPSSRCTLYNAPKMARHLSSTTRFTMISCRSQTSPCSASTRGEKS